MYFILLTAYSQNCIDIFRNIRIIYHFVLERKLSADIKLKIMKTIFVSPKWPKALAIKTVINSTYDFYFNILRKLFVMKCNA